MDNTQKDNLINAIKTGKIDEVGLLNYVSDNDVSVAIAVAESPWSSPPILDIAAHDNDRRVRWAALNNKNIEMKTLRFLCNDNDLEISNRATELIKEKV